MLPAPGIFVQKVCLNVGLLLEVIICCAVFVCKHLLFDILAAWCFCNASVHASHSVVYLEGMLLVDTKLWNAYVILSLLMLLTPSCI